MKVNSNKLTSTRSTTNQLVAELVGHRLRANVVRDAIGSSPVLSCTFYQYHLPWTVWFHTHRCSTEFLRTSQYQIMETGKKIPAFFRMKEIQVQMFVLWSSARTICKLLVIYSAKSPRALKEKDRKIKR